MANASSTSYPPVRIIVDTREQRPYQFAAYDADVISHKLKTGDYSLAGYEESVALERKSLDDLIGCLTTGRDRFERELERARKLEHFAVIVEASLDDVMHGRYRSRLNSHAALQSILSFQMRYGTNFVWAGSRAMGEYCTYWSLEKYRREKECRNIAPTGVSSGPVESRATLH